MIAMILYLLFINDDTVKVDAFIEKIVYQLLIFGYSLYINGI